MEEAFEKLKSAQMSAPVLCMPDFELPFLLQTDTSEIGLDAMVLQEFDGEEHPVPLNATTRHSALAIK